MEPAARLAGDTEPTGRRVVWINGAFGSGKSSVAELIAERDPGAALFDPELLGPMLWQALDASGDFQDLPQWRALLVKTVATLHEHGAALVVMPMSVLRRDYFGELRSGLRGTGAEVLHVVLDASANELRRRAAGDAAQQSAAEWRALKLEAFLAARGWLFAEAELVVETETLSVADVAAVVVELIESRETYGR